MSLGTLATVLALSSSAFMLGCTAEIVGGDRTRGPKVLGLSRASITVGEQIEIVGGGFVNGPNGYTSIHLEGEYVTTDGKSHAVDMTFRPHWEDGNTMLWAQFGPFQVPFSPGGDELGTFTGTVTAINTLPDKSTEESEPTDVTLEVLPSIIIRKFQPVGANCSAPSKIILGGFAYEVTAEAIGFEPKNFSYVIFGEPGAAAPRIIRREAKGTSDTFGGDGEIAFALNDGTGPFYVGAFAVVAVDQAGTEHAISLTYGIHNVMEYVSGSKSAIAELEPPTPVSGCFAGGDTNGRTVTYTEMTSDTRTRTVGTTWDETFLESASSTQGASTSTTNGVTVTMSESSTQGWELGWMSNRGGEFGGSAEVGFLDSAKVSVGGKSTWMEGQSGSVYGSTTRGYSVGRDYSQTDTESWAYTTTVGHNVSEGGSDFWSVSSTESISTSFQGFILPGEFGTFYRQATRMAIPGAIVAYNLCGIPSTVAQTNFYDYIWAADLAQGATCEPLPKSSLPQAECFLAPCASGGNPE